jgi:hypothetical protein
MGNNEIIEKSMNDEIMEENVNVQIETNKNPENEREEKMKINMKNLMHKKNVSNRMEYYICVGVFISQ